MNRPPNRPVCKHGIGKGSHCSDCAKEHFEIARQVRPLIAEFWERRDSNLLEHLFIRAFKIGQSSEGEG